MSSTSNPYFFQLFNGLYRLKPNIASVLLITLLTGTAISVPAHAAGECEYLGQYMAPLESPVENWHTALAGPPPGEVQQRLVGPEECRVVAEKIIHNAHGVPYRQVTMAIGGTVFGYAPVNTLVVPPHGTGAEGEGRENTFTDHVFILQSRGNMGPYIPGTAQYQYTEDRPSSVEILIPQNAADWNGSMYVLVHGASDFGPLRFNPREPGKFNRYTQTSLQAGSLIDKGYAVVWTRRDTAGYNESNPQSTHYSVLLDTGIELGGTSKIGMGLNNHLGLIRDWAVISQRFIEDQLDRQTQYKFFRGHSAGAALGRSYLTINGMNIDHTRSKLFDGFFLSDTAAGLGASAYFWEALVIDEHGSIRLQQTESDNLTFTNEHRRFMSPTVEVIHGEYAGSSTSTLPHLFERVPGTYFEYKLENTRITIEKGLGEDWKSYVIFGTSHSDASAESFDYPELAKDMVDIGGVEIALHQALYDRVITGKPLPHTRIDAVDVWELDPDAGPAIHLPDTACPRGIYRPYMNRPDGTSVGSSPALFVPYLTKPVPQINEHQPKPMGFKEEWLEPLDANGYLVDMTGSRHRMTRPSIQQIWHVRFRNGEETGILRPNERLTRQRYAACVRDVARALHADRLLTEEAVTWYIEKAQTDDIGVD